MVYTNRYANRLLSSLLLPAALGACGGAEPGAEGSVEIQREQSALEVSDKVFTDGSGDLTIQIRTCDYPASTSVGSRCQFCAVDRGWVMIGGGAEIEGTPVSARLRSSLPYKNTLTAPVYTTDDREICTGNTPDNDLSKDYTAWMARADGLSSYRMRTYVIGLQVAGLTEDQLRGFVHYDDAATAALREPSVEARSLTDYLLVGGGADEVGSSNCFLTESRPNAALDGWRASAYCSSAPGALKAYAIYLNPCLPAPGWSGCLSRTRRTLTSAPVSGYGAASIVTPYPWVTAGVGGVGVVSSGASRFLADLLPIAGHKQGAFVTTNDAGAAVSGPTTAYSIGLLGPRGGMYRHNVVRFAHPIAEGGGLSLYRPAGLAPVGLRQATLADAAPYRWSFESLGGDQYRLRNANPNAPAQGECAFRQPGTSNIQVGPCGTTDEYKWTFIGDPWAVRAGSKLRNVSSSTCLDNNNSTTTNTGVKLATCADGFSTRQSIYLQSQSWLD